MNRDEQFDKNLELARHFFLGLLDQPVENWPESGTTIVFAPADDEELTRANHAAFRAIQKRHPNEAGGIVHVVDQRLPKASKARSGS